MDRPHVTAGPVFRTRTRRRYGRGAIQAGSARVSGACVVYRHVVGVDFTFGMLRVAARGLSLAAGDALRLPFPDSQFDAIVSAFVVRNLADVPQGVKEQVRVLRQGGRMVVLETTPGPPGMLRPPYRVYFRHIVPLLGRLIAGDGTAYTYLPESTLSVPRACASGRPAAAARPGGRQVPSIGAGLRCGHVGTEARYASDHGGTL